MSLNSLRSQQRPLLASNFYDSKASPFRCPYESILAEAIQEREAILQEDLLSKVRVSKETGDKMLVVVTSMVNE